MSSEYSSFYQGLQWGQQCKSCDHEITIEWLLFTNHAPALLQLHSPFCFFAWKQRAFLGWCRHSLKLVFGMINDTCNLRRKVQAVLRLGEENWTALDKGVGGPRAARWKPHLLCHVALCCNASQGPTLWNTMTWFPSTSSLLIFSPSFFFGGGGSSLFPHFAFVSSEIIYLCLL